MELDPRQIALQFVVSAVREDDEVLSTLASDLEQNHAMAVTAATGLVWIARTLLQAASQGVDVSEDELLRRLGEIIAAEPYE